MTQIRYEYLQNSYPLADSGEFPFGIGAQDVITRLDIEVRATNGATNNQAVTIADVVTSFELLDGSNVVCSLSGAELAGIIANRQGRMPVAVVSEVLSVVQRLQFSLDFGRWYGDEDFALDLSKFKNLQARLTWNLAAVRAVGATGFVTGTARYTVIAHIMEGARNPIGYLSLKRHFLFTTVASGEEPIELPTDRPLRSITIRSYEAAVGALSGISNVRLSADEGKFKPMDLAITDFLQSLITTAEPFSYRHDFHALDADTIYTLLKYRESVKLSTPNGDIIGQYTHGDIGEGVLEAETASSGIALAADTIFNGQVQGWLPFSCAYLPFGDYVDPSTWLQPEVFKKLVLYLEQNNAGAACSVILEQAVPY